jgi:chorismate mutase|tara:strand:+ start:1195 stop:1467 length:273 start_codon:yes stop_codon:yes gene_type:complete
MNKKVIKELRNSIDKVDDQIFDLILKRFDYVEKIGNIKKEMNMPVDDKAREEIIIERLSEKLSTEIDSKEIKKIIGPIISISKDIQRRKK